MDKNRQTAEEEALKLRHQMEKTIYHSIDKNEPEILQRALDDGYDPNIVFDGLDPMGRPLSWYPLHFCCEKGRDVCARALLAAGADPDVGDRWCMTPLMYAIQREWHNMVELMIESGATVDIQDTKGRTPLHLAMECTDTKCIEILCKANATVNIVDQMGRTPLWNAVTKDGRIAHVKEILPYSAVNLPDNRDKRTPIQEAISYACEDRLEYVKLLLEAGSEVNHRDEANMNTMLNLIYTIRRRGKGVTDDDYAVAIALLDAGYLLNDVPPRTRWHKFGGTAIKMAAEHGLTELVDLFLSRGANPNLADDCNVTPLLAATFNNRLSCVVSLIRSNCQLDVIGELRMNDQFDTVYLKVSPIQCAISKDFIDIARLLVLAGASLQTEKYLFSGGGGPGCEVPLTLVNDCDFWCWLVNLASHPSSLFDIAVKVIRESISFGLNEKLEQLPIPSALKQHISFNELLQNFTMFK